MKILGTENETYILLSGIEVPEKISLSKNVTLLQADTSHLDFETAISICSRPDDIAVVAAFIQRVSAQLRITGSTPKELAVNAWNSNWDAILLSAIFNTEVSFNIQSNVEAGSISSQSNLRATNFHFQGITTVSPYKLTSEDIDWVTTHFEAGRLLLDNEKFQTAVHCLASYRWHSMPRVKMAVLWAGIEGLFGASTEIRFRISLYISRFLHPDNVEICKEKFELIKKLYNSRSSAVHGTKIKGDISQSVETSAEILKELIRQIVQNKAIPNENELVP